MRKLPYREGTWFAVPLRRGGFGVGIVARAGRKGKTIFAYFFGPKRLAVPLLAQVKALKPRSAVLKIRVGDLALVRGTWPIIGCSESWDRSEWPMPAFIQREPLGRGRAWRVRYSEDDLNVVVAEEPVDPQTTGLEDGLDGAGSAEIILTKLLTEGQVGAS